MPLRDAKPRMLKASTSTLELEGDILHWIAEREANSLTTTYDDIVAHFSWTPDESLETALRKLTSKTSLDVHMAEVDGKRQRVWSIGPKNPIDYEHQTAMLAKVAKLKEGRNR